MDDYSALKSYADPQAIFDEGENTLPYPPKGSYDCHRIKRLTNLAAGAVQIDFEDQKGNVNTTIFFNDIQKGMLKKYLNGEMSAKEILDECKKDPSTSLGIRMGGHNAESKIHFFYILHPGYSEEWQVKPWPIFVPTVSATKRNNFAEIDFNRPDEKNEIVELRTLLKNNHEALMLAKNYIEKTAISISQFIQDVKRCPKALIKRGALPAEFILESSPSSQQVNIKEDQKHLPNTPEKIVVNLPGKKVVAIPLKGLKTINDILLYIRTNSLYPKRLCLFDSNYKKLPEEFLLSKLDLSKALESDHEDWQDDY